MVFPYQINYSKYTLDHVVAEYFLFDMHSFVRYNLCLRRNHFLTLQISFLLGKSCFAELFLSSI